MEYRVFLTPRADKELQCIDKAIRVQIADAIDRLRAHPLLHAKRLKTPFPGFRIREGDYRILYIIENDRVMIYSIAHRKDAYR